jgi:nucleoside-diphosphate-sugar epimerase
VLGASGAIGLGVLDELKRQGISCQGAARTKREGWIQTDLLDTKQTSDACKGATHIYLCAGLAYSTPIWQRDWPRIMGNVIAAAEATQAKIIFVDNIYMYGPPPLRQPITEDHPQEPTSQKGKVRKEIAAQLLKAHKDGKAQALIARSPDFYGPGATNSLLYIQMLANMLKGKKAQWIGDPNLAHTFGYVEDISRAMVTLALDDEAYGQTWHTPTSREPATASSLQSAFARELGTKPGLTVLPMWMIGLLKHVVPILGEVQEMTYQYTSPYIFSSEKFDTRYPAFAVTPYQEGIAKMVAAFR